VFLLASVPWLAFNLSRPLLGPGNVFTTPRIEQYFANRPDLEVPFRKISQFVGEIRPASIGIAGSEDSWEYPLWVLLQQPGMNLRIEHVLVENPSSGLVNRLLAPAVIVADRPMPTAQIGAVSYDKALETGEFTVLLPMTTHPGSF
jgi:hypothetical protein